MYSEYSNVIYSLLCFQLTKSTSNLNDVLYGGRPKNEEPHVKRTTKKKSEKIDYIVRVDLEELKIGDDEFEDLQSLFILFDLDKDGILNAKEFEKILRCLGYRLQGNRPVLLLVCHKISPLISNVNLSPTYFGTNKNVLFLPLKTIIVDNNK